MLESDDSKRNLNKIIDRFLDSKDVAERQEQLTKLTKVLQVPDYILLIQNDAEIKAKIDTVVRELWVNMHVWDSKIYKYFYLANKDSEIIQSFYTKALVNEKNTDLAKEYLKSNIKLFNSQDIIDNVNELASLTNLWDYAALLLSANGIFDENLFRKYIDNNSYVINKEITKNYRTSHGKRELLKFLKLITIADPTNTEYILDYLEALDLNLETPSLVSLLKTVDIDNFKEEGSLIRLSSLFIKVGEYQKAMEILQRVISVSQNNQEAIELYVEAMRKLGEWELIVSFLAKRKSLLRSTKQLEESFVEACVKMKNYREALDYIESLGSNQDFSQKSILYIAQLYLFEGNSKKAKNILTRATGETLNSRLGLKLDAEISKQEGKDNEYFQKCIKYIKESPEDSAFIVTVLRELENKKLWNKILEISNIQNIDRNNQEILLFILLSNIETGRISEAIDSLSLIDFQYVNDKIHSALLGSMRTNEKWSSYSAISGKLSSQMRSYLEIIRDYVYGNTIKEKDVAAIQGFIEGEVLNNIIWLNELWKHLDTIRYEEAESKINLILSQHGINPDQDINIYNYPRLNILLMEKKYDKASSILLNVIKDQDPYTTFYSMLAEDNAKLTKGKIGKLESAYNQLSASPFRALLLQVKLEDMDAESVIRETEEIVNNGGGLHVPWASIYDRLSKIDETKLLNFIDLLEFSGTENLQALRVLRKFRKRENNTLDIINLDSKICKMRTSEEQDKINYIIDLKDFGSKEELDSVINEYAALKLPAGINSMLGDYYLVNKDPVSAEHFFRKSLQEESREETTGGLVESLLEQGKFKEAEIFIEKLKNKSAFTLKLYEASGNVEKLANTIKGIGKIDEPMEAVLENIVDKYWENRIIKNQLISLLKKTSNTSLGLDISSRMISEQKSNDSLEILRMLFRNNPADVRIITVLMEKLAEAGKFEEANTDCFQYLKLNTQRTDKIEVLARMERINFNNGLYKDVLKLYEMFPDLLNADSTETVALTLINTKNFDIAENLLSREHQKTITQEKFTDLMNILKNTENRAEIIILSERLMKACIKHNKFLDKREAVMYTKIKVNMIDEIYEFLNAPSSFEGIDMEYLEQESCRIMKNIYKKTGITTVEELTLPIFFLGNGSKDIELVKMIKDYVDDSYYHFKVRQVPKDPLTIKLLQQAASMPYSNPFVYSVKFNLGIRGALKLKAAVQSLDGGFA